MNYDPDVRGVRLAIRFESRIHLKCARCGAWFDPRGRMAGRRDDYNGKPLPPIDGGCTYRFALIVDCHKGWPRDRGRLALAPELFSLVQSILAQPVVDFGEFY